MLVSILATCLLAVEHGRLSVSFLFGLVYKYGVLKYLSGFVSCFTLRHVLIPSSSDLGCI